MNRPRRIENQPRKVGGESFDPSLTRELQNRGCLDAALKQAKSAGRSHDRARFRLILIGRRRRVYRLRERVSALNQLTPML